MKILVIDDEADAASPNTLVNQKRTSTINNRLTNIRNAMRTIFCNWFTSFVVLVTREPVENLSVSAKEKLSTFLKRSALRSAPKF